MTQAKRLILTAYAGALATRFRSRAMSLARLVVAVAVLLAGFASLAPASACGYSSDTEIGSNDCTGGATDDDQAAMNDIRAAIAAQRAENQE